MELKLTEIFDDVNTVHLYTIKVQKSNILLFK